jgi:hypothetical protein
MSGRLEKKLKWFSETASEIATKPATHPRANREPAINVWRRDESDGDGCAAYYDDAAS